MGTERRRRRTRRSRTDEAAGAPAPGAAMESGTDAGAGSGAAQPVPAGAGPRVPTPNDLAERGGTFAMTAEVLDPEEEEPAPDDTGGRPTPADGRPTTANGRNEPGSGGSECTGDEPAGHGRPPEDSQTERGLRGLVGAGSSQVGVGAALRARDAARPTEADLATAEAELVIVRRGWVPREDLPPRGPRH